MLVKKEKRKKKQLDADVEKRKNKETLHIPTALTAMRPK
jgi:hypothetical protein